MLDQLEKLLKTVPLSAEWPGFTQLIVHALDPAQPPVLERDLRNRPLDAKEVTELACEYVHTDSAYEVQSCWDLWGYDLKRGQWQLRPERLELICHGEEYDDGIHAEAGHFQAYIGFEHLFTGHAGLLGSNASAVRQPQHPAEAQFMAVMQQPEKLREYRQKTRENIKKLMDWIQAVEQAIPVERLQLWSEGEDNFEARLDEILAVR